MIFPTSSANTRPIAPALLSRAQEMEEGQPGLYVLAAREFRYPVQQQELNIHAEQYRKMNLLEKFMLQAYTEIVPRPSLEELAEALGLDPVFIKNTFQDLISMQSLAYGVNGPRVTHIPQFASMIFGKLRVARIALSSSKNMAEGGRQSFAEKPGRPHEIVLECSPIPLLFGSEPQLRPRFVQRNLCHRSPTMR